MGRLARGLALAALLLLAAYAGPAEAAEFGIVPGSVGIEAVDGGGDPDLRAGAHPDLFRAGFELSVEGTGTSARDLAFEFGPGLAVDPTAAPTCLRSALALDACPSPSRIGDLTLRSPGDSSATAPIFALEPEPDQLLALGTSAPWATEFEIGLRPGDYGLTLSSVALPPVPIEEGSIELWGVAADGPFLTTPTQCGPLKATFRTHSLEASAPSLTEAGESAPFVDCESLPFAPGFGLELSNPVADSPTGALMELSVPEYGDPAGQVGSQVKDAKIELPREYSISVAALDTLTLCGNLQFGLGTSNPISCASSSKVGSVELTGPSFRQPLTGAIYMGPGASGERFRLLIGATGGGAVVKLTSSLRTDPNTGVVTLGMEGLPRVSWSALSLDFSGGPNALLATPLACGSSTGTARFAPYANVAPAQSGIPVSIAGVSGSPCTGRLPFAPGFANGITTRRAGAPTSFFTNLSRRDGEQLPARFAITLPRGLSAAPAASELCSEVGTSTGFCPPGSRVGPVVLDFGSGPSPASLKGDAYLTGPYRRAPFGLVLTFRVALGSLDLGRVSLRAAVRIDRLTGQVTIESDSLPKLVEGIPIRLRALRLDLDREGFIRNATSCAPKTIASTVRSYDGASIAPTSPYAVNGCGALKFQPSFSVGLSGRAQLRAKGHPALRIASEMPRRNTNLRDFSVRLPKSLRFDSAGVDEMCARTDAIEGVCPKGSRVGAGSARTSLLDDPLKGPVFVVQPKGDGYPDLWTSLRGGGMKVDIGGQSLLRKGRFVTRFVNLPDMPLSRLAIELRGGKDGIMSLGSDPCPSGGGKGLASQVVARGQDGARRQKRVRMELSPLCPGGRAQGGEGSR